MRHRVPPTPAPPKAAAPSAPMQVQLPTLQIPLSGNVDVVEQPDGTKVLVVGPMLCTFGVQLDQQGCEEVAAKLKAAGVAVYGPGALSGLPPVSD